MVDTAFPRCTLGGVHIDLVESSQSALDEVIARVQTPEQPPLAVASVNLDHVHHFGSKPGLFSGEELSWLFLLDGAPVVRRVRQVTKRPWPCLAGSDLLESLLERCVNSNVSVGFLGGSEQTHHALRKVLIERMPDLRISGMWAPGREELVDPLRSAALAKQIQATKTDVLLVCLGKPLQEVWMAQHGIATGARAMLAFGAAIDFLAGNAKRAPRIFRRAGAEWAWRFIHEPARLSRRYLVQGPRALAALYTWSSPPRELPSNLNRLEERG